MLELFKFFLIRLYGGTFVPVMVLFFFSFWGWKGISGRVRALNWVAACLLTVFFWRIMWLASSGGRLDRYYVVWGVVGLLLIVPGARGIAWWGKRLRLNRLGIPPAAWWLGFLIAILGTNLGKALYPPDRKDFLLEAVRVVESYNRNVSPAILLDATAETPRFDYLAEHPFPSVELPRLRSGNVAEFGREFLAAWRDAAPRYEKVFFFTRQFPELVLDSALPLKLEQEYVYRKSRYVLFSLVPAEVYSSETLQFMRSFPTEPLEITIHPGQLVEIPFDRIFPLSNLGGWIIRAEAPYGVYDAAAWRWLPETAPQNLPDSFELKLSLWDRRNLPVVQRTIQVKFGTESEVLLPELPLGVLAPGATRPEKSVAYVPPPMRLPAGSRVMFFSNGMTQCLNLSKILPDGLTAVQRDNPDRSTNSEYQVLLRKTSNPYRTDGLLSLTEGPLDAVVLLLGQHELARFGPDGLVWGWRMDELIAAVRQLIGELKTARPELKIAIGTLPFVFPGPTPLNRFRDGNIDFYNQAVARYNDRISRLVRQAPEEDLYLLRLDSVFGPDDFKPDCAWELNAGGRQRLAAAIRTFFTGK